MDKKRSPDVRHAAELQAAIRYLLIRMAGHEPLRYHMLGTESYRLLVIAYANACGRLEALEARGYLVETLSPDEVLAVTEPASIAQEASSK